MRIVRLVLLIIVFVFVGHVFCPAATPDTPTTTDLYARLKQGKPWSGILSSFPAGSDSVVLTRGTGEDAGKMTAYNVIEILKIDGRLKEVTFESIAIIGDIDFSTLPQQEYEGTKVKFYSVKKALFFKRCRFAGKLTSKNDDRLEIVFGYPLEFEGCHFNDEFLLENPKFNEKVIVKKTFFHQDAIFYNARFNSVDCKFSNVIFEKTVVFSLSRFKEVIQFNDIRCEKNAYFKYIKSKEAIDFSGSYFLGEVDFGVSEFSGKVSFEDVNFEGPLFFVKVNEKDKKNKKITKPVHFLFNGANFKKRSDFRESHLGMAYFCQGESQSLVFFDEANFRKVTFQKADFTGASFNTVDFTKACFGERGSKKTLTLKDCSYKQMIVSWEQLSKGILSLEMEEEDFMNLIANFEEMKKFDDACEIYYLMKNDKRMKQKWGVKKAFNYICWAFGYFVRPFNVILIALFLALTFSFFFIRTELKAIPYESAGKKDKRKIFLSEIPVDFDSRGKEQTPVAEDPTAARKGAGKEKRSRRSSYLKKQCVAFLFSLALLAKIQLKGDFIDRETVNWIKVIAVIEWYLGYFIWGAFLYSLARRSSILQDILSGLPIL